MDDLIPEFLTETNESLAELDISLVQLEQNPGDKDLLSQIFRVMHTIKGTSGFLNLPRLGSVAHKAEDLLGLFRDDKLQPTPSNISLIFEALDRIKMVLASLESTGKEPEGEDGDLINRLAAACHGEEAAPAAAAPSESFVMPEIEIPEAMAMAEPVHSAAPEAPPPPAAASATANGANNAAAATGESNAAAQSLRVSVDVLEGLMTLVSELVLTRNQILQISRLQKDNEL